MSQYDGSPLAGRTERQWWLVVLTDDRLLDAAQVCAALDAVMGELKAGDFSISRPLEVSFETSIAERHALAAEVGPEKVVALSAIIQARVNAREDREIARVYLGELLRERRLAKTGPAGDGGEET